MTFGQRVQGVLMLDPATYEEIEADPTATTQALSVVVISSVAAGIGNGLFRGPGGLIRETIGALVGWVLWAGATYVIGARVMPEQGTRTNLGELLRVIGFAFAPVALALVLIIPWGPFVDRSVRVVEELWLLATMVMAVRHALDYTKTWRAVAVVLGGLLVFELIQLLA